MLNNLGDIQTEVLARLGQSTTTSVISGITSTMLDDWTSQGNKFATSYKKWPFTEGRLSTTFTGIEEWNFEGIKSDSIRIMLIGGKRLRKLNFADYQIFKEENTSANDRVFSDFGGLVYVNPLVDLSGTLTTYSQYSPVLDVTDKSALTVFSGAEEDGNEAIVEEMLSYANNRDQKLNEAQAHHFKAMEILEAKWKRILDEQYQYQTHPARDGMWKRFDVLDGRPTDQINRDQF